MNFADLLSFGFRLRLVARDFDHSSSDTRSFQHHERKTPTLGDARVEHAAEESDGDRQQQQSAADAEHCNGHPQLDSVDSTCTLSLSEELRFDRRQRTAELLREHCRAAFERAYKQVHFIEQPQHGAQMREAGDIDFTWCSKHRRSEAMFQFRGRAQELDSGFDSRHRQDCSCRSRSLVLDADLSDIQRGIARSDFNCAHETSHRGAQRNLRTTKCAQLHLAIALRPLRNAIRV